MKLLGGDKGGRSPKIANNIGDSGDQRRAVWGGGGREKEPVTWEKSWFVKEVNVEPGKGER